MEKSDKKITIQSVVTIFCVIVAVLLISTLIINLVELGSLGSREKELLAKIDSIDRQIESNNLELSERETDEYIDRIAREYLNMRGRDEITFISK